jgi:hypothetical protein
VSTASQLKDIYGVVKIGICYDRYGLRNLTNCKGNVGVHHVVDIGDHQRGILTEISASIWKKEIESIKEYYARFGD